MTRKKKKKKANGDVGHISRIHAQALIGGAIAGANRWSSRPANRRRRPQGTNEGESESNGSSQLAAAAAGPAEEGACSEVADDEDTRAAATQRDKSKEAARARQVETCPFCASIFAPSSNALDQLYSENRRFARRRRFAVASPSPSLRRRFAVASPSLHRRFAVASLATTP